VLVQPTLVDAHVIDVPTYRSFVDVAMGEVLLFDSDPKNAAKPPHCALIAELYKYRTCEEAHEDEINLIVEFDESSRATSMILIFWVLPSGATPYQ
jgi:hypothetical protein